MEEFENEKLSQDELKLVNALLTIGYKIKFVYDELANANYNHLKGTNAFTNNINLLKLLLDEENKIIDYIKQDYQVCCKLFEFFVQNNDFDLIDEFELAKNNDSSELVRVRLITKLNGIFVDDNLHDYIEKNYLNEDDVDEEYEEETEYINSELLQTNLEYYIENDLINSILYFLEQEIDKTENINIKNYLISYKYNLIFMYTFIEDEVLKNNFNLNDNLIWKVKLFADMTNFDDSSVILSKSSYAESLLNYAGEYLLCEEPELEYSDTYADVIVSKCFIRSALLFANPSCRMRFNNFMEFQLEEIENNEKVKEMYNEIIENDKDRTIPLTLSLKK